MRDHQQIRQSNMIVHCIIYHLHYLTTVHFLIATIKDCTMLIKIRISHRFLNKCSWTTGAKTWHQVFVDILKNCESGWLHPNFNQHSTMKISKMWYIICNNVIAHFIMCETWSMKDWTSRKRAPFILYYGVGRTNLKTSHAKLGVENLAIRSSQKISNLLRYSLSKPAFLGKLELLYTRPPIV